MAESSFALIARKIYATPEFRAYSERVRERVRTFDVVTLELARAPAPNTFRLQTPLPAVEPEPVTRVICASRHSPVFGAVTCYTNFLGQRDQLPDIRAEWFVRENELVELARGLYDRKEIPTFNCRFDPPPPGTYYSKKDGERKIVRRRRDPDAISNTFPNLASAYLREMIGSDMEQAHSRIHRQATEMYYSPEHRTAQVEFAHRQAIDEIRGSLLKYRHLPEPVLLAAFREFLVMEVLES